MTHTLGSSYLVTPSRWNWRFRRYSHMALGPIGLSAYLFLPEYESVVVTIWALFHILPIEAAILLRIYARGRLSRNQFLIQLSLLTLSLIATFAMFLLLQLVADRYAGLRI